MSRLRLRLVVGVAIAFLLVSCKGYSKHMRLSAPEAIVPAGEQSVVVFVRPADEESHIQSSVFELGGDKDKLVGIVSAATKVAYVTTPGVHTFMLIGERADFLKAELNGGKTYYVLVMASKGSFKANFTFQPLKVSDLRAEKYRTWIEKARRIENTSSSYAWAQRSRSSIQGKKQRAFSDWQRKSGSSVGLLPEDGD